MSLAPPATVEKLQAALHAKAERAPTYRFYALYDKLYRPDVLAFAYARCRANGGAPGVDDQTFADIEAYGLAKWLGELTEELRQKTYQPQPVRRVWIPKPDGKQRPLGIPIPRAYCISSQSDLGIWPPGSRPQGRGVSDANEPPEQQGTPTAGTPALVALLLSLSPPYQSDDRRRQRCFTGLCSRAMIFAVK
jgi:hypothetical protein